MYTLLLKSMTKSQTKSNNEEEIGKLTQINSGIDDLKNRTKDL